MRGALTRLAQTSTFPHARNGDIGGEAQSASGQVDIQLDEKCPFERRLYEHSKGRMFFPNRPKVGHILPQCHSALIPDTRAPLGLLRTPASRLVSQPNNSHGVTIGDKAYGRSSSLITY